MARTPQHTVILLAPGRTVRGDIFSGGECVASVSRAGTERPLLNGIESALTLQPKLGRNVWVGADNLWTQTLTLPHAVTGGLSEKELAAALAFEAEPLSGISSTLVEIGSLPGAEHAGKREFHLVALERSMRDSVQREIQSKGGTLKGIASLRDVPARESCNGDAEWLKAALATFTASPATLPRIGAAPRELSTLRIWVMAALLEAAVLALCFAHSRWSDTESTRMSSLAATLRAPQQQIDALNKTMTAARGELQKLDGENQALASARENLENGVARQRARCSEILRGLAAERPKNSVIDSLKQEDAESLRVEGRSLQPELADEFAARLKRAFEGTGLNVVPLTKAAQGLTANGGPWHFTLYIATALEKKDAVKRGEGTALAVRTLAGEGQ